VYRPKPWKIARMHSSPLHNVELVLEPRKKPNGEAIDIFQKQPKKQSKTRTRSTK
jgi:hypothetical protein